MWNPEKEAARGLAYNHALDVLGLKPGKAWVWASDHWMEFLTQVDADPTGQMLQRVFAKLNRET